MHRATPYDGGRAGRRDDASAKAEEGRRRLHQGMDADDASVAAGGERHRFGGDGGETPPADDEVARYWATLTAKPTAPATRMARASIGRRTAQSARQGLAPSRSAVFR